MNRTFSQRLITRRVGTCNPPQADLRGNCPACPAPKAAGSGGQVCQLPARIATPARQPDGSHGGGQSVAGGSYEGWSNVYKSPYAKASGGLALRLTARFTSGRRPAVARRAKAGAPSRTRTYNLMVRNHALYPIEL